MRLLENIKQVFISPKELFEQQAQEKDLKQGFMVFLLVCAISIIIQLISIPINPSMQMAMAMGGGMVLLILMLIGLIITLLAMAIGTGIIHLCAKLCGGTGEFKALFTCVLFMQAISLIGIPFSLISNFMNQAGQQPSIAAMIFSLGIAICLMIFIFYLMTLSVKICYKLSTSKAVLTLLIPIIALVLIISSIVIVLK